MQFVVHVEIQQMAPGGVRSQIISHLHPTTILCTFICRWDEGVDTPTAPGPASGSLCYKHIEHP